MQKDLQTGRDANLPALGPLATNPRPYPQFSSVTLINSLTDSSYDALQAQLRRRFSGTTWQVSYTYAKAISNDTNDNASTNTDPWNTFGNDDRGLDENDRRQALSVSVIAPLPLGHPAGHDRVAAGRQPVGRHRRRRPRPRRQQPGPPGRPA